MRYFLLSPVLVTLLSLAGCTAGGIYVPPTVPPERRYATIETARGTIRCVLRADAAPKTVANFGKLANERFYDGHTFFRVESGLVIQGGSPNDDASGDIGYTIEAEIGLPHYAGALAMARTDDSVNPERRSSGSQFYITMDRISYLDGGYTVFGYCTDSLDVIRKIQQGDKMRRVRVEVQ